MPRGALRLALLLSLLLPAFGPGATAAEGRPAVGSREDATLVASLVRAHLVALHQANISGNYSVLRDIGSRPFQAQFTPADLSEIFAKLRRRKVDLQSAVTLQPTITEAPRLDANNVMHLAGTFPTVPVPVGFEFAFAVEDGVWKLAGLRVEPAETLADLGVTRELGYAVPTPRPFDSDLR